MFYWVGVHIVLDWFHENKTYSVCMTSYVVMSKPNNNDIMNEQDFSCLKMAKWFMFHQHSHDKLSFNGQPSETSR